MFKHLECADEVEFAAEGEGPCIRRHKPDGRPALSRDGQPFREGLGSDQLRTRQGATQRAEDILRAPANIERRRGVRLEAAHRLLNEPIARSNAFRRS